jgi:hypothetical protein
VMIGSASGSAVAMLDSFFVWSVAKIPSRIAQFLRRSRSSGWISPAL